MEPGKWVVSRDEEHWTCLEDYDSREAALVGAVDELELEPGETFYVGKVRHAQPLMINGEDILERMRDRMYEDEDESIEDCSWLEDVDPKQEHDLERRLNEVWIAWLKGNGFEPDWFRIDDVETHRAPDAKVRQERP